MALEFRGGHAANHVAHHAFVYARHHQRFGIDDVFQKLAQDGIEDRVGGQTVFVHLIGMEFRRRRFGEDAFGDDFGPVHLVVPAREFIDFGLVDVADGFQGAHGVAVQGAVAHGVFRLVARTEYGAAHAVGKGHEQGTADAGLDIVGGEVVTTFDVRMKEPNREPALSPSAIHTIEHLAATFLRNHPVWSDRIIYWGPMGCLTGNYLIVKGDIASVDILPLVKETFAFVASFEGYVPGATARDCGNYLLMNLPEARWEARKYLAEVLENITEENLFYPV